MSDFDTAQKAYEELQRLRALPDVTQPGETSDRQRRIALLEASLAAFGLAAKGRHV